MWLVNRLKEPSTYAGLGIVVQAGARAAATMGVDPSKANAVALAVEAILGMFAMFMTEKTP